MNCNHRNIHFEDFFDPEKQNQQNYHYHDVYCSDCGETKGRPFATRAQKDYCRRISNWLGYQGIQNGANNADFRDFLRENGYYDLWNDALISQKLDPNNFKDPITGQGIFFEFMRMIEYLCLEFKKEKDRERDEEEEKLIQKEINAVYDKLITLQNKDKLDQYDLLKIEQIQGKIDQLSEKRINSSSLKGNIEDLKDALQEVRDRATNNPDNPERERERAN